MDSRDLAKEVQRLKPGESLTISRTVLYSCPRFPDWSMSPASWPIPDQILEHISGSAYEFAYTEDPFTGNVTFRRLLRPLQDGRYASLSPDRREGFSRDAQGYWKRR